MANKAELLAVGGDRSPTRAREDYVKAIYQMAGGEPVRAAAVARYLAVSRVSVSKAKRVLESDGLLEHGNAAEPLRLSRRGRKLAVAIIRRHRLLETFLHTTLHVPLERVHAEAERIEHAISDDVAWRIATLLHRPACDPHGHPIPYGDSLPKSKPQTTLASLRAGASARVESLDDRDDRAIALFAASGVLPGSLLHVEDADAARVTVRCGKRRVTLRRKHAAMVRVAT